MNRIIINNIGPISNVELSLNKVNVLMGPQSSGKSTIAKIISFCQWAEKRFILDGKFDYDFREQFINFHRISEVYFNKTSSFKYESDFVSISQKGTNYTISIKAKKKKDEYRKSKNIYIPAERNFASVIPNLNKYNETNDNIMNFLYDWFDAKKSYNKKNSLPVLNLNVSYHYTTESDSDILYLSNKKKEILLKNASSGLQSVTPLIMLIDYLTGGFYQQDKPNSVIERDDVFNTFIRNFPSIVNFSRLDEIKENALKNRNLILTKKEYEKLVGLMLNRREYFFSNFIIEEPEQNLFPSTQRDLIYYLLDKITKSERDHSILLTTHSPFILYAINNCIMGKTISSEMPINEQEELKSRNSWIDTKYVSIWQIENGINKSVIDERTGTVTKHYFNEVMNELMDEYYEMLNYFKYDNKAEV